MSYLSAIKDILIVVAVCWLLWMVYHLGQNSNQLEFQKAIQQQLVDNQKQQERWHDEQQDAFAEENSSIAAVHAHIDAQHKPVIVQGNGTCPVSGNTPAAPSVAPATRTTDIRPGIDAFERKYEDYLSSCRLILKSWPK